jgi:membrane protease YdiL (CAAX protease family)
LTGSEPSGDPPNTLDRPDEPPDPDAVAASRDPAVVVDAGRSRTLGLTSFSIEGRRAPALFVVGWLATIIGIGVAVVALGVTGGAGPVLWIAAFAGLSLGLLLLCGSQAIERRAAGATYAGPSPILVFLAVVVVAQVAGFAIGLPLSTIGAAIPRPVGDLLAVLVQAVVFIGVVRLTVVGTGALGWRDMGLMRMAPGAAAREVVGGAVFAGPVILVTGILAIVVVQLIGASPPSPLPPTGTPIGLVLHLLAGAVVAPFAEEVLFRGFALTAWRRSLGARAAIVRSSILFVVAHVLFVGGDTFGEAARLALVAGIVRIPIALTLGWLFVRTGKLWGPVGLHAAFNAILITLAESAAAP